MEKGVAFKSNIHKAGVKPRHQFFHFCHVDVSNRERCRALLGLELYQIFVFQQSNRDVFLLDVNYYFAGHFLLFNLVVNKSGHTGFVVQRCRCAR